MHSPCPMHTLCQNSQYLQKSWSGSKGVTSVRRAGEAAAQGQAAGPQPGAAQGSLPGLSPW